MKEACDPRAVWQQEGRPATATVDGGTCCLMMLVLPWAPPCTGDAGCMCELSGVQRGRFGWRGLLVHWRHGVVGGAVACESLDFGPLVLLSAAMGPR